MKTVFILHHVHAFEDGHEDHKIIGVFKTVEEAREALRQVKLQLGFIDTPEGFEIAEWKLGNIGWPDGYVTQQ